MAGAGNFSEPTFFFFNSAYRMSEVFLKQKQQGSVSQNCNLAGASEWKIRAAKCGTLIRFMWKTVVISMNYDIGGNVMAVTHVKV